MVYRFGPFELNADTYELLRDGEPIRLRPIVFDVLVYLVRHEPRVVPYQELLENVWKGQTTEPSAVHWAMSKIRTALRQLRGSQTPIETVPRRGYRFVGELSIPSEPLPDPLSLPGDSVSAQRATGVAREAAAVRATVSSPSAHSRSTEEWKDPFIGRRDVLQILARGLSDTKKGKGGLFLLLGESGIGKSRTLLEFAGLLRLPQPREAAPRAWLGVCPATPAEPLAPWIQILEACSAGELVSPKQRAMAESLLDELRRFPTADTHAHAAAHAFALLGRVRTLLLQSVKTQPAVLFLDDLQHADQASIDLLVLLLPQLRTAGLMIVASVQEPTIKADERVLARLSDLRARARCISLGRWSRREVGRLAHEIYPGAFQEEEIEHLWQRSRGNPFFVHELLRFEGAREESLTSDADLLAAQSHRDVPISVQELLRAQLGGLPAGCISTLHAASVLGRAFSVALLQRVTGLPIDELTEALEVAARAGFLEPSQRLREHEFRHALIRDAIYRDMPGTTRAHMHRQVAEALEDPAFGGSPHSVLAWHFYCAIPVGDARRAVEYARKAASEARSLRAFSDAARYREWALEAQAFCSDLSPEERCGLRVDLGEARIEEGEAQAGRRHLIRAIELAEAQDLPRILARAGCALRHSMVSAAAPDASVLRALEQARVGLDETDYALRSQVASYLASLPPYTQRDSRRQELLEEAYTLAELAQSAPARIHALRSECLSLTAPADVPRLLTRVDTLAREAQSLPCARGTIEAHLFRYLGLIQLGRMREGVECIEGLTRQIRDQNGYDGWLARHLEARHAYYAGQLDHAVERYEALRSERVSPTGKLAQLHWLAGMSLVRLESAAIGEFWPRFVDLTMLWRQRSLGLRGLLLRLLVAQQRLDEVSRELELVPTEELRRRPVRAGRLGMLAHFALASAAVADLAKCDALYQELEPYATYHAVDILWFSHGPVSYFLGVLAEALDKRDLAVRHFEAATSSCDDCEMRPHGAWSRFRLARALSLQTGRSRSRSDRSLLRQVERDSSRMRLESLLSELSAFGARHEGRHAGP